jgi:DNA helicase HerA-like ATPase
MDKRDANYKDASHERDIDVGTRRLWSGKIVRVGLSRRERRRHLYTVGKTGAGKTTLLRSLILQDIRAGHGAGVIDPHGELAEALLDAIPKRRTGDVIYFDPAEGAYPIGLNVLESPAPEMNRLVASGVVAALKSIWKDSWGPRLEYILYNAVAALVDFEGATLVGVVKLLTDEGYRERVVRRARDPVVRAFWTGEFARYDRRFRTEAIAPIQNKVGRLLSSAPLRNVLGQVRSTVDLRRVMDGGQIFIANLSRGRLGEDESSLLGALLAARFQVAAMARADTPEPERRDFFLYVDEFHIFTTSSFDAVLSEGRKYRISLTLAHQYIGQLDDQTREAVFGNAGTIIAFRVGGQDAEFLAREFDGDIRPRQLSELEAFEVWMRRPAYDLPEVPERVRTLAPASDSHGHGERILRNSRVRFGRRREIVEDKIRRFLSA